MGRYRLGIDIGGTFTDFSLLDETTGELFGFKSPTVPGDSGQVLLGDQFASGWRLDLRGAGGFDTSSERPATAFGWAASFDVSQGAAERSAQLTYVDQWKRTAECWVLLVVWAAVLWITRKPSRP